MTALAPFTHSTTTATTPAVATTRVLVIEDHDRQSVDLMDKLAPLDVVVTRARTGTEAIRIAAMERPDVIFVDGLLPGMHGFEVARFIRHIDASYRPYIVMTTAIYKNIKYRNEAVLKYGIDDYLVKPVAASVVENILNSYRFFQEESREAVAS
jgi:response regulator RpfG family c-di-GMP phosphodiesterase